MQVRRSPSPLRRAAQRLTQTLAQWPTPRLKLLLLLALMTVATAALLPMPAARACQQVEQFSGAASPVSSAHAQLLSGASLDDRLLPAIATRLGTTPPQVQVIDTRAIVWSDGCLGVTASDQLCTQALVGGIAIAVTYGGKSHQFHASSDSLWPVAALTGYTDRVCRLGAPARLDAASG